LACPSYLQGAQEDSNTGLDCGGQFEELFRCDKGGCRVALVHKVGGEGVAAVVLVAVVRGDGKG
jgi:hypothetical protein